MNVVENKTQLRAALARSRATGEFFPVRVSVRKVLRIAVVPLVVAMGITTPSVGKPNSDPRLRPFVLALAECVIADLGVGSGS